MRAIEGSHRVIVQIGARPHHLPWQNGQVILLILLLALIQALAVVRALPSSPTINPTSPVWTRKPVLGYFIFTASLVERLPDEADLTPSQFKAVQRIAEQERQVLIQLELETVPIIEDDSLSLQEKRSRIAQMKYNSRVMEAVHNSRQALIYSLGPHAFTRLSRWIERQWEAERLAHGSPPIQSGPRTYRVYATRYDSGGAYTIALPDKCLKFANGGNHVCDEDGYIAGLGYTVYMSYEKSTAATVAESGPWNVDDNYWATTRDPTPRRMFTDLALGMPEAQAAYFNGYNGGVDQFGRVVTAPFGIDLARQVSIDIGLEPGKNDWIDVSFLWTEGWDSGSAANPPNPGETAVPAPTQATIIPIAIASPNADGSVVHLVQEGQTLWNIVAAYQVNLNEILSLNGIADGSYIYPGQRLVIKPASQKPPPSNTVLPHAATATSPPKTPTPVQKIATQVAQVVSTPIPTSFPNEIPTTAASPTGSDSPSAIDPILIGIASLGALGVLLFIIGQWAGRRK
jgi:hypothetical protein